MSVNLTSVGLSGIYAAEAELGATESNISNASNPNYAAESVNLAASAGPEGVGNGVQVLGTESSAVPFLEGEINSQSSTNSYNQALTQVETLAQNFLAPSSGSDLAASFQTLINDFSNLAASPQNSTLRATAISDATAFAQNAQSLSANLQATAANDVAQLPSLVSQVNQLSTQIAALNSQIQGVQAEGSTGPALVDQRNGLVSQLANLIGASADTNGDVSVNGIPLVSGTTALQLQTTGSGTNIGLEVILPQGTLPLEDSQLGGTIGGTVAGAANVLQLQSSVNSFATSVANAINNTYQNGYGLDGSTGNQLFLTGGSNGPIAINPAVTVQNFAAAATAAGIPGDGSNSSTLAALASTQGIDASFPTSTPVQAFSQIESQFGTDISTAQQEQQQASSTLQSLQQLQSSISGVSLNEQLTNMIQYQNALEAASQAVQAAGNITLFLIQELNQ
jgi:flagellar hook-associated protein 1